MIQDLLRDQLGYAGVVISDDLGVAEAVATVPVAIRGTRFLKAGGDLVINVSPATTQTMIADTRTAAQRDSSFAAQLDVKVVRVLRLKARLGLVACRAE